ncbi:MAG: protein translocase subunit SecF [Bacteriovoracaceae bacterium]
MSIRKYRHFNFNFAPKFNAMMICSSLLFIASVVILLTKGLNFGVDFRGGSEIQVKFSKAIDLTKFRSDLESTQFKISSVQSIGSENEYLIKVQADDKSISRVTETFQNLFTSKYGDYGPDIRKTDIVGPKAGEELRWAGFKALLWAIIAIMIYVGLRFDMKYAPGVAIALVHDVVITTAAFAVTGYEFSLQIVAALLAIIGYSVNDTVIIYDRIRENEERHAGLTLTDNINRSINETLTRTLYTSGTTFTVSTIMLLMGGGVIHDFFFAISFGIVIGTYSSGFVAGPITILMEKFYSKNSNSTAAKQVKA